MKVIVTGGAGFIGSALLDELIDHGKFEITALTHNTPLAKRHQHLNQWKGGLSALNLERIQNIQPHFLFHLARPTYPKLRQLGRWFAGYSGARLNKKLLMDLETGAPKCKLIYVSGSLMYGQNTDGDKHAESSILNPISYARQYVNTESPINSALTQKQNAHLILRVPWVLGNGSWFRWIYNEHFQKNAQIPLFGDGKNRMQFILLENLAKQIVQLALDNKAIGIRNVFDNVTMTQLEFAEKIANQLECDIDSNTESYESAIQEAFRADIELDTEHDFQKMGSQFTNRLTELVDGFLKDK